MERFGRAEEGFPCGFKRLAHGIPSCDAFTNPFNAPDPGDLQRAMLRLAEGRAAGLGGEVTAIDGKTLCRSFPDAALRSPPHPVRAWAWAFVGEVRPVLGQVRVEGKSNGIAAMPALLEITAPKGDRGTPYEDMKPYPDDPAQDGNWQCRRDADGGHGRIGTRTARVVCDIDWFQQRHRRPGLAAVGKVVRTRGGPGSGRRPGFAATS